MRNAVISALIIASAFAAMTARTYVPILSFVSEDGGNVQNTSGIML